MKKQLKKKLDKIDRSLKYFWRQKIKNICTYQHFMCMLNGDSTMRKDVEQIIQSYLNGENDENMDCA